MKIYLVKKDVNKPAASDNWIQMNGYEFSRFMNTEDGKARSENFITLSKCSKNDYCITIECNQEEKKGIENDRKTADYHTLRNSEYETLSFDEPIPGKDPYCGEEAISGKAAGTEEAALVNIRKEARYAATQKLLPSQQELVWLLYLSPDPMSEDAAADNLHCMRISVHQRKKRMLQRLKQLCEGSAYLD
ncbi:MAG: hypothetical protein MJ118_06940, partial [Clostridia bacterium]|nr:hypothetical protein [Clostridia bacterium]